MWQSNIAQLRSRGLSQVQIAALCGCGQATISDLDRGKTSNPGFQLGQRLTALVKTTDRELARLVATIDAKSLEKI